MFEDFEQRINGFENKFNPENAQDLPKYFSTLE
jgi:hypothetical protein